MKRDLVRQITVVLATLATIVVNGLANALPLNGQTTGEISDRFDVYFVPAGYVFSIWGLIYLGLILFAAYQALPSQRANPRLRRIGHLFVLGCAANIAWLFLWHYEHFPLTILAMLALLASLVAIYLRLGVGKADVRQTERWLVHVPFSIYLGWVSVATIANATALLDYLQWGGLGIGGEVWAALLLLVGAGLGAAMAFRRGDAAYVFVLAWAFVGIAVKQVASPLVAGVAWAMAGLILLLLVTAKALQWKRGKMTVRAA